MKCDKNKLLTISSNNVKTFKNVTEEMQEAAASIVQDIRMLITVVIIVHKNYFLVAEKCIGKSTVEGNDDQVESITKNPGNYY